MESARIQSLAQELPCASGAAIERKSPGILSWAPTALGAGTWGPSGVSCATLPFAPWFAEKALGGAGDIFTGALLEKEGSWWAAFPSL